MSPLALFPLLNKPLRDVVKFQGVDLEDFQADCTCAAEQDGCNDSTEDLQV